MDIKNSTTRSIIYRLLVAVILVAGIKIGWDMWSPKPMAQGDYQKQMVTLAARFGDLEKMGQTAAQGGAKTPQDLFKTLGETHAKKADFIKTMKDLTPPEKYKELHSMLVEWKDKEFENETKMLEGFKQYSLDQSKTTEDEMDKLSNYSDEIAKTYDAKTAAIAKKNGFDSVDKFLSAH